MICVKMDGTVIASACVIVAGRTMKHIMAGTKRLKPDLRARELVHWAVMRRARALGLATYDVMAMGAEGIASFKAGYHLRWIDLVAPCYLDIGLVRTAVFQRALMLPHRRKARVGRVLLMVRRLTAAP